MVNSNMRIKQNTFVQNGRPFFIYSGEIHYFRIPATLWEKHLKRAKDAGLNTISFYIPWVWHEQEQGKFDWTGRTIPEKNLVGFLRLAKKYGLKVIARVGPVSNAELINEGLPAWLVRDYPEIYAKGSGANYLPHVTIIAYENPAFRKYLKRWYENVLPVVREHLDSKNGPVILVQLCNEIGMVHWLNKMPVRNSKTLFDWREFLRDRYVQIEKLNVVWQTKLRNFDKAAFLPSKLNGSINLQALSDWGEFWRKYYSGYYAFLVNQAQDNAIMPPYIINIPQFYDYDVRGRGIFAPMTTSMFRDFSGVCKQTVFGGAYQMRRLDYENFHDIAIATECIKMITTDRVPSMCAELQSGKMTDRPRIYPSDVSLNLAASCANGLNGLNCYMFSGGRNQKRLGVMGTYHEWQAPVASGGSTRPHYKMVKEFGEFIKKYGEKLATTSKVTGLTFGFYLPYWSTEYVQGELPSYLEEQRNLFFFDGLARLLTLANRHFDMIDLERIEQKKLNRKNALFVFSLEAMSGEVQQKIARYVLQGGKLLLSPTLPQKDLSGRQCTVLGKALGLKMNGVTQNEMIIPDAILSSGVVAAGFTAHLKRCGYSLRCRHGLARAISRRIPLFGFETVGDIDCMRVLGKISKIDATGSSKTLFTVNGKPCGILKNAGRGKAAMLGFGLNHTFDYEVYIIDEICEMLGIKKTILIEPWDISVMARADRKNAFVFAFNYHEEPKRFWAEVNIGGKARRFPSGGTTLLPARSWKCFPLSLRGTK